MLRIQNYRIKEMEKIPLSHNNNTFKEWEKLYIDLVGPWKIQYCKSKSSKTLDFML